MTSIISSPGQIVMQTLLSIVILDVSILTAANAAFAQEGGNTLEAQKGDNILKMTAPLAPKTARLIRKPVEQVFEAFVDPDTTTKFWFSKSSGRLEEGKTVDSL